LQAAIEGDPADGNADHAVTTCMDHWWAAMADTLKGMYNYFAETGVFISVYHHGMIWTILDMMWSGKLCVSICLLFLWLIPDHLSIGYNFSVVGGIAARPGPWL